MHTFHDRGGRAWAVVINVASIKRVRGAIGVDLYGLVDNKFEGLGKLLGDPVQLVDVLYVLCQEEADRAGITDEMFGAAMAGDCIEDASVAFLAELRDFFPNPRVREALDRLIAAGNRLRDRMLDHAIMELENLDVEAAASRLIAANGAAKPNPSSGPSISSPASSASTPAP